MEAKVFILVKKDTHEMVESGNTAEPVIAIEETKRWVDVQHDEELVKATITWE